MAEFNPGDKVMLKSGGPPMTIRDYSKQSDDYGCEWFLNGKREMGRFKATSIEKLEPPSF